MRRAVPGLLLVLGLASWLVPAGSAAVPDSLRADRIPPPRPGAMSGTKFAQRTAGWSGSKRQEAALAELRRGNVPESLRNLKPVRLTYTSPMPAPTTAARGVSDSTTVAIVWVTPDYLAIGSDADFLEMPLTYPSAVAIADEFGFILPTRKIVDAIYEQATCHLKPEPLTPGPHMRSSRYYLQHRNKIRAQRWNTGCTVGELTAGHKKDVVLTNRLHSKPDRIAIYGWHRHDGDPIQPLSTVHAADYADYSHGIRLVYQTVWINGSPRSVIDVLDDPVLGPLLTYEGEITDPDELMNPQGSQRQGLVPGD